jgi:outer membrane protein W
MLKTSILFLICLVVVVSVDAPANAESGRSRHDRELMFGAHGLDNINLSTLDGNFGFRYFLSDNYALRPSFSMMTSEYIAPHYNDDFTDREESRDRVSISMLVECHLEAHGSVYPYWGLGGSIQSESFDTILSVPDSLSTGTPTSRTESRDSMSIVAAAGFQWEITDAVRLGVEYLLKYRFTTTEHERLYHNEEARISESEGQSFGASTSSLYLAVRF